MRFSEKWLREWVAVDRDVQDLCQQLTMNSLEVEGLEQAYPELNGVVIARVTTTHPHPETDTLTVCQLDTGHAEHKTVVCSGNPPSPGMNTALAMAGSQLPDGTKVQAVDIKGVLSQGVLCSRAQLGLPCETNQAMAFDHKLPPGTALNTLFDTSDHIIDISPTPNRGDCLSIQGIAREIATINQCKLNETHAATVSVTTDQVRAITLNAPRACPRYLGRVISGLDPTREAPFWMQERLRCSGLHPVNPVVDITNYVMLELGQPLHAFDNARLSGEINIRYPNGKESLTLLNGITCDITPETLLVADEQGPQALAGIMGGLSTSVNHDTRTLFLECAYFSPDAIIGRSRKYGLHTDASHRFERGVDPQLQHRAMVRATELILSICGGQAGPVVENKSDPSLPQSPLISLRAPQIERVLGTPIATQEVTEILGNLGMEVNKKNTIWQVRPPSYRFDIQREIDLIEELARVRGYASIPNIPVQTQIRMGSGNPHRERILAAQSILAQRGYQEAITFSFVDPELQALLEEQDHTLDLANPIAPNLAQMRLSLWPGLIKAAQYNLRRQQKRIRLFEIGMVFKKAAGQLSQTVHISGIAIGNLYKNQLNKYNSLIDLYDIKADVEALLKGTRGSSNTRYAPLAHPLLHPGQASGVYREAVLIGHLGRLHPNASTTLELPQDCYLFELNLEKLQTVSPPKFSKLSKFPAIKRDLALLADRSLPVNEILDFVAEVLGKDLVNLELFDIYQGEGIHTEEKSLALSLTFQRSSSTLTDDDVQSLIENLLCRLAKRFGIHLRDMEK